LFTLALPSLPGIKSPNLMATCWVVWSSVHFGVLYSWNFEPTTALIDTLVSNMLLALTCILAANNLRYYRPQKGKYIYILVFCAAISGLWLAAVRYILHLTITNDPSYSTFLEKSLAVRFNIAFLITICVTLMGELWLTMKEQKENETRKTDAEKLTREAELYKLRQQLQPHFLFNSLNSISALVKSQPEQARTMIQQLSDFLRGTLKKEDHTWTTLGDELQHLQLYLDIEKVRFGHRLNTDIIADENTNQQRLPHMLLQPIVENAIKFGLYDTTEPVTIRIQADIVDNYLVIAVQNPFDPETASPKTGTGFGLASVQRRLYLLFARADLLTTTTNDHLFITTIKIPQAS
jgi:two-component system LytT family sensor kinase